MKKVLYKFVLFGLIFAFIFNFNLFQNGAEAQNRGFDIGTAVNPSIVWYHNIAGWHDQTADATDIGENDVVLTTNDAGEATANFAHYVGYTATFRTIFYELINLEASPRPVVDDPGIVTWEYYSSDTLDWETLTVNDYTKVYNSNCSFTVPTDQSYWIYTGIKFEPPDDWGQVSLNGNSKYYIRGRTSTAYSTAALGDQIWVDTSENDDLSINNVELSARLTPTSTVTQGNYTLYQLFYHIENNNDFDLSDIRMIWQIDDSLTPIGLYAPSIIKFFADYPGIPWPNETFHQAVLAADNSDDIVPMEYLDDALNFDEDDWGDLSEFYDFYNNYRTLTIQNLFFPENENLDFFADYIQIAIRGDQIGTWPITITFMAWDQFGHLGISSMNKHGNLQAAGRSEYGGDYVRNTVYLEVTENIPGGIPEILPETGRPE